MRPLLRPDLTRPTRKAFQNKHDGKLIIRSPFRAARYVLLTLLLATVSAVALHSSSAAPAKKQSVGVPSRPAATRADAQRLRALTGPRLKASSPGFLPFAAFWFSPSDAVSTFASGVGGCGSAQSSFTLGDTVCAQASGPLDAARTLRRVQLVDPDGFIVDSIDLTSSPLTVSFTLPTDATVSSFGLTLDNRGTWRINIVDTSDASVLATAPITVHDPSTPVADLQINKNIVSTDSGVTAGVNIQTLIHVYNYGPDAAQNVKVNDVTPANTTFQSLTQTSGPTFTCTTPAVDGIGTSICTLSSLPMDGSADFTVTYKVSGSIANNTDLTTTATTSSDTPERQDAPENNTSSQDVNASNPTTPTCTLTCPANVTATADTTEPYDADGDPNTPPTPTSGAHVTLPDPQFSGSTCGAVTPSVPSGSFFPVGSTPVTYTAADGTSCEFIVTVTSSGAAVSISCPANVTANADADCQVTVTLGTPATTGDNVTVNGSRSDGKPLNSPFTSGTTIVTWTASNDSGTVSCNQTVTIVDVTPPVINIPAQSANADANCQAAIPDLTNSPGITDNCGCDSSDSVDSCAGHSRIAVTQSPAPGTLVGLGAHTITLTANDGSDNNGGAGNTTTANVTFTVVDTTPPTFTFVPPAVTAYTGAGATSCGTTIGDATLGTATASDNCSVSVSRSPSGNTFPVGTTTVTWTATDGSGNTATATQAVTVVDNTPPVISCPANITVYLPLHTTATSMAVSYPAATATDNCGVASIGYTVASGSVFPVGSTPVTATATDVNGNTASCTFTVTVLYDFTGFFSPVSNPTTVNAVNAGRAIPVKFSLSGNKGLNIFAANSPSSAPYTCGNDATVDVSQTVDATANSINYDASSDQYNFVWKTDSSWAGQCRTLSVTLNDGSTHTALFKFK